MLAESKELIENYHHYFKRIPRNLYWLVIVDNHFNDRYYFFLYNQKKLGPNFSIHMNY
ncbi:hypothetical protein [Lentilactobacillus kisonensis]|uniref:hypothetical protein n=1 Tax=Lentilactobacillus kisonensis TaxID=481722 RepID=UPI000A8FF4C7|nr:hypothetical protein [Lentilactobacillus kisonensis]